MSPAGLQSVKQFVIHGQVSDGVQGCLVQEPTENKSCDGEPDLPIARRIRSQPDKRQCQGSHTQECEDDKTFSVIPLGARLSGEQACGWVEKLAAVLALYCVVLNLFGTERALFHCLLLSGGCLKDHGTRCDPMEEPMWGVPRPPSRRKAIRVRL